MAKKIIHKPKKNTRFAVIDCETNPFSYNAEIEPFLWGFYDGETYKEFRDSDLSIPSSDCSSKLIDYLKDESLTIYAHNGGKFDYFFLLEWVSPDVTLINGRIAVARIGENTLHDSYLILPSPLSSYKKDEIDYSLFTPEKREKHIEKISHYCKMDCIYLYEWLTKFKNLWGDYLTIASAGFAQIKKKPAIKSRNHR